MKEDDDWIPLESIDDNQKIWVGTKVRLFGIGLKVEDKSDDYNDYLVSYIYDNNEFLQLTNLSQGEAGNIICVIIMDKPNHYSLGKTLKEILGVQNTFVLFE